MDYVWIAIKAVAYIAAFIWLFVALFIVTDFHVRGFYVEVAIFFILTALFAQGEGE